MLNRIAMIHQLFDAPCVLTHHGICILHLVQPFCGTLNSILYFYINRLVWVMFVWPSGQATASVA